MAIRIAAVRSSRISDDQKEVLLATNAKYTGDLELRFSSECLDDAIAALSQASSLLRSKASPGAQPGVASFEDARDVSGDDSDQVRFEVPANFAVTADASGRDVVLLILNHKLEGQRGYALSPDAARRVAGGLLKSVEVLLADRPAPKSTS